MAYQIGSRSKEVEWYHKDLGELKPAIIEVLEKYSKIPSEQIRDHVYNIRERAWEIEPYPCIGGFRFLDLNLCTTPQYPEILSRLRSGEKLLDLGCCFGQELRRLILDGAPPTSLYGVDLRPEFLELGHELFNDRATCEVQLFTANLLEEPTEQLRALQGKINIVYAGAVFHLFDRVEQLRLAVHVIGLLAPQPGSLVLGRQTAEPNATRVYEITGGKTVFRHNEQSWQEMWDEAGKATGSKWKVETRFYERSDQRRWTGSTTVLMQFSVRRV